jgi:hypothetical protein
VCLLVCFLFSYRDPPKKTKKINIFRCPITLRATNFILVTLLSLCPSWLSLVLVRFVFLVLVFYSVLYLCRSPIPPSQITNGSTTLIGLPLLAALRELSLRQPYIHCDTLFEPFHPLDQLLPSQTASFWLIRFRFRVIFPLPEP